MSPLLKSILSAIISGAAGGTIPAVAGTSWMEILVSAGVAAVIGLINLWVHKPTVVSDVQIARK